MNTSRGRVIRLQRQSRCKGIIVAARDHVPETDDVPDTEYVDADTDDADADTDDDAGPCEGIVVRAKTQGCFRVHKHRSIARWLAGSQVIHRLCLLSIDRSPTGPFFFAIYVSSEAPLCVFARTTMSSQGPASSSVSASASSVSGTSYVSVT